MKVTIVGGGGAIGSTAAFVLAQKNIVDEVCLIDIRHNLAKDHEMDMGQAVSAISRTVITSGGWERLEGSDIVVLAMGAPALVNKAETAAPPANDSKLTGRLSGLHRQMEIVPEIVGHLKNYAPQAVILNAANPVDVLNAKIHQLSGFDKNKIIGFSYNDTIRFRWAIAQVLNIDAGRVRAFVLGEHGEAQCPIASQIYIDGEKTVLAPEQYDAIMDLTHNWLKEKLALKAGRTSPWLSGIYIPYILEAMIRETGETVACSVIGEDGVSIGETVVLDRGGLRERVPLELNGEERNQFQAAKNKIADILKFI